MKRQDIVAGMFIDQGAQLALQVTRERTGDVYFVRGSTGTTFDACATLSEARQVLGKLPRTAYARIYVQRAGGLYPVGG